MVVTRSLPVRSRNHLDIIDITDQIAALVSGAGVSNGVVTVFCPGSTGAVTTIEYEPGLKKDLRELLENLAPSGRDYHHHATWGDRNGSGHLLSALLKTGLSVPVTGSRMTLGTWQQIVFVECDSHGRDRELVVQLVGE